MIVGRGKGKGGNGSPLEISRLKKEGVYMPPVIGAYRPLKCYLPAQKVRIFYK